jgi:hypothetical protein
MFCPQNFYCNAVVAVFVRAFNKFAFKKYQTGKLATHYSLNIKLHKYKESTFFLIDFIWFCPLLKNYARLTFSPKYVIITNVAMPQQQKNSEVFNEKDT